MPQVSAGQVPQVSSIRSVGQNCIGSACNQMPQASSIRSVVSNQMPQVSAHQVPQVSADQVPQLSSIRSVGQNCIGSACNQMPQVSAKQVPQVSSGYWNDEIAAEDGFP